MLLARQCRQRCEKLRHCQSLLHKRADGLQTLSLSPETAEKATPGHPLVHDGVRNGGKEAKREQHCAFVPWKRTNAALGSAALCVSCDVWNPRMCPLTRAGRHRPMAEGGMLRRVGRRGRRIRRAGLCSCWRDAQGAVFVVLSHGVRERQDDLWYVKRSHTERDSFSAQNVVSSVLCVCVPAQRNNLALEAMESSRRPGSTRIRDERLCRNHQNHSTLATL